MDRRSFAAGAVTVGAAAGILAAIHSYLSQPPPTTTTKPTPAVAEASTTDSGIVAAASGSMGNVYESNKAVSEYLLFHYGADDDVLPYAEGPHSALQFPRRTAAICADACQTNGVPLDRVLDVGCAVGAASFHLAKDYKEVVGVDFSHAFVAAANSMKSTGRAKYTLVVEADIKEEREALVSASIDRTRCTFQQGDACALDPALGTFNVIHAANLLCRLPNPTAFLKSLPKFLKPGGLVVLVSPYSWMTGYTAKDKWVGGFVEDGKDHPSNRGVQAIMEADFRLLSESDVPFLIREHARKFQWGCSHCTVWQLR